VSSREFTRPVSYGFAQPCGKPMTKTKKKEKEKRMRSLNASIASQNNTRRLGLPTNERAFVVGLSGLLALW